MGRLRGWRSVLLVAALALCGGQAFGASFSFTGAFSTDDQLQSFTFTLAGVNTVTLRTWSYAGGTNQASMVIPEGGFDPYLSLYDATGNLVQVNDNGTCGQVATDSVTGACFDSFISQSLAIGMYTLVLTQSDNGPAGTMLSDGFIHTGDPTFTSSFACSNGQFCDSTTANRTNQWAVDIDNVSSAGPSGIPEPGTLGLLASGLAAMVVLRRRKVRI
jgi:PEP-CTERM motif